MPSYIVTLREGSLKQCCSRLDQERRKYLPLKKINALALTASNHHEVAELVGVDHIAGIDDDQPVTLMKSERIAQPKATDQWGLERIGATFQRIPKKYPRPKVALIDTGISTHPCIQVARSANFSEERTADDLNGHGTHLAGCIAGFTPAPGRKKKRAVSFHGVFPGLSLYNVKAFNAEGRSTLSHLIRALEWTANQKMDLVHLSFGFDQPHPALHAAVSACARQGMILVAPGGDDGRPGLKYPARYDEVIAVGSTNRQDQVSTFSHYGTALNLVAPGEEIYSTWPKGFRVMTGPTPASAIVTGCIALLLAKRPDLNKRELDQLLASTNQRLDTSILLQGEGLIQVKRLLGEE